MANFAVKVYAEIASLEETGRGFRTAMRPPYKRGMPAHVFGMKRYARRASFSEWSIVLWEKEFKCIDCGCDPVGKRCAPMLRDDVWDRIADQHEHLCDRCTRRRLGRPICLHDLRVCAYNMQSWKWLEGPRWSGTRNTAYRMTRWAHAKAIDLGAVGANALEMLLELMEGIQKHWGQVERGAVQIRHLPKAEDEWPVVQHADTVFASGGRVGESET